ncbi:alpha/beta hydrolase [Amycolatopsis bartoniae]|uniref:Alpha/beta hydrolase n=2 Tax=Amycolatopsis bartoniae TaxID=941986 RepID=A0A8H9M2M6_9PSEU|nr:alpha/beta hydrolase [Amycolatopsis bartoniae]GHF32154.1 alpha/beta hydrolase [Amycolatopsis bartoniae]
MPFARSNNIELCYETTGDPADPAMLLIHGVGEQLLGWPDGFCELLAARGFHVIRFDNRDVGLSTWFDELGDVDLNRLLAGDLSTARYRFSDLVADTAGLLDTLDLPRVHLVGASMGGGIAQQLAIDSPERVASLASIMSTTSDPAVGGTSLDNPAAAVPVPGADREAAIAAEVALYRLIGSPGLETADEELARRAAAKYDRAFHPAGTFRQIAANATAEDRTEDLRAVDVPTVVIHGDSDPLVGVSGGRATAEAVPGAELLVIPGMGHDLPEAAWTRIADAIAANATRA